MVLTLILGEHHCKPSPGRKDKQFSTAAVFHSFIRICIHIAADLLIQSASKCQQFLLVVIYQTAIKTENTLSHRQPLWGSNADWTCSKVRVSGAGVWGWYNYIQKKLSTVEENNLNNVIGRQSERQKEHVKMTSMEWQLNCQQVAGGMIIFRLTDLHSIETVPSAQLVQIGQGATPI